MVSGVLDMLSTAIRKSNGVGSADSLAIRSFSSVESSLGVIISNGILVGVRLWGILWLLVRGGGWVIGWLVDNRLGVVDRLGDHGGWVVGWLVNHWCGVVGGFVNNRGWVIGSRGRFVGRCRGVVDRGWARVVRGRGWGVVWCGGGMVRSGGGVIGSGGITMGQGSRGMNLSYWFFIPAIPMDGLRSSMGLASD